MVLETIHESGSYENKAAIPESKKDLNIAVLELTEELRQAGLQGFCLGYLFPNENKNRYEWQPKNGKGYIVHTEGYRSLL